jgi:hypothetical protein
LLAIDQEGWRPASAGILRGPLVLLNLFPKTAGFQTTIESCLIEAKGGGITL